MNSNSFEKKVNYKLLIYKSYIQDVALNNSHGLICHLDINQPSQELTNKIIKELIEDDEIT